MGSTTVADWLIASGLRSAEKRGVKRTWRVRVSAFSSGTTVRTTAVCSVPSSRTTETCLPASSDPILLDGTSASTSRSWSLTMDTTRSPTLSQAPTSV